MLRLMLRAKIHRATVTDANLEYEGSLTVDPVLLEAAGILPYEQVSVSNLNNGERFETYVIPGTRGAGAMILNGPAARKGAKGDKIIVFKYKNKVRYRRKTGHRQLYTRLQIKEIVKPGGAATRKPRKEKAAAGGDS